LEAANPSGGASTLAGISDMSAFMRTVNDDTTASAARNTLGAADSTATVNLAGDQTVNGVKGFSSSPTVPTPTTSGQAANKAYVDTTASAGTPDADGSTKGKVQLAGDLAGTADSPSVAKVKGITISGTAPTTGQVLTASSTSAAGWATPPATQITAAQLPSTQYVDVIVTTGAGYPGARPTVASGAPIRWWAATEPPSGISANNDAWVQVAI
jgi:hypothetical protein